ncbi:MAG TPA: pyridoxal-dependent decarboxylase [Pyrinomonadaceae bacterium]|nr:pyridoxal-dependent decarboxylase [Pyrinomonadaceae bacterium]
MSETNTIADSRVSNLGLSKEELGELSHAFSKLVTEYFATVSELPVYPDTSTGAPISHLNSQIPLEGGTLEKLLADFQSIIRGIRHNGHPRQFGYVASPATPAGAFAELVTSALNVNVTAWRSAPAATELERMVVRWLGGMIGFSESAHGLLTSGGSMANLVAMLIAHRTKAKEDISGKGLWNCGPAMTLYASDQVHMSVLKAIDILGIGREQVRTIKADESFHLNVGKLRESVKKDLENGFVPFCVVASAGTVNTGAVDPLNEIAEVAAEFDLWFHVDGAYGVPATLDERKRSLFAGLHRADSVSLDAHKWLYVPIDAGCLLFRDQAAARAAFASAEADYIKVLEQPDTDEAFAFWDYGVELSRRFRALKIWLTFCYYGLNRIAAAISEDILLAEYLGKRIQESDDFELLAPIELSICCFRYLPKGFKQRLVSCSVDDTNRINRELNDLNTRLMQAVQRSGQAYLSNATIAGKFALRACITNFRTTGADIDKTLEVIREVARREPTERGR